MDYLSIYQMLHRRFWCKNDNDKEKKSQGETFPASDIGKSEISRICDIWDLANASLIVARVCSHTFARTILHISLLHLFFRCRELLFPPLDLWSHVRSLRYLCTLRSRTHVVVRMHTCAYICRVLRKLAPYASIQISHVCTYFIRPAYTPVSRCPSLFSYPYTSF